MYEIVSYMITKAPLGCVDIRTEIISRRKEEALSLYGTVDTAA